MKAAVLIIDTVLRSVLKLIANLLTQKRGNESCATTCYARDSHQTDRER